MTGLYVAQGDEYHLIIGKDMIDCMGVFHTEYLDEGEFYLKGKCAKDMAIWYKGKAPEKVRITDGLRTELPNGYGPLWVFLPNRNVLIFMEEGSGANLEPEDIEAGNVDYINYKVFDMDDGEIQEGDGGMMLLPYYVKTHFTCLAEAIPQLLDFLYDEYQSYTTRMEVQILGWKGV